MNILVTLNNYNIIEAMNISDLIQEGKKIRTGLVHVQNEEGYQPNDFGRYYEWTQLVERFLYVNFPDDECNREFNNARAFYHLNYNPKFMDEMIGILTACEKVPGMVPTLATRNRKALSNTKTAIWDILRRELKRNVFDGLAEITLEKKEAELEDNRIFEYIKSLGTETLARILKQILYEYTLKKSLNEENKKNVELRGDSYSHSGNSCFVSPKLEK